MIQLPNYQQTVMPQLAALKFKGIPGAHIFLIAITSIIELSQSWQKAAVGVGIS
jgi:hypothetical protein